MSKKPFLKRLLLSLLVSFAIEACCVFSVSAQPVTHPNTVSVPLPPSGAPEIVFQPVLDTISAGTISVVNGVQTKPQDWPALVVARTSQPGQNGVTLHWTCTATLVGPRVVLTAAHCIDGGNGQSLRSAALKLGGIALPMQCEISPVYIDAPSSSDVPRDSADYALCLMGSDLSQLPGYRTLQYEVIDYKDILSVGNSVLVTGYGCTSIQIQNGSVKYGPVVDILRVGGAKISDTTGALSLSDRDYVQTHSLNSDQAAICPGDSGGPLLTGVSPENQAGARRVTGVNSSVDIQGLQDLTSRYASLATDDFRSFLKNWLISSNNPIVCGVNRSPGTFPCRS